MSVINIKLNGIDRPLGYDLGTPLLSWQVTDGCIGQKKAAVTVYEEPSNTPLYQQEGDLNWEGTPLPLTLQPRKRYRVCIAVTDEADTVHEGETWFETGLMDEPWQAKWITCEADNWAPTACGSFSTADAAVKKARLYMVGLGVYDAALV